MNLRLVDGLDQAAPSFTFFDIWPSHFKSTRVQSGKSRGVCHPQKVEEPEMHYKIRLVGISEPVTFDLPDDGLMNKFAIWLETGQGPAGIALHLPTGSSLALNYRNIASIECQKPAA